MDITVDLLQWSLDFPVKKISGSSIENENIPNKDLAEELHKPITRKFNNYR